MDRPLGSKVGQMRALGVVKQAKMLLLPVSSDASAPPTGRLVKGHAKLVGPCVVSASMALVFQVGLVPNIAQVLDPVIGPDAVDVIDGPTGPDAMNVRPDQTVNAVASSANNGTQVARAVILANN